MGLKLFVRHGKRVAERAVSGIKAVADEIPDEPAGQLSLATTQTQARYGLAPVIDCFRRRFPDVHFHLYQGTSEQIAQMICSPPSGRPRIYGQNGQPGPCLR